MPNDYKEAKEELRRWLVKWTGCYIQGPDGDYDEDDLDDNEIPPFGWPCGTCTTSFLGELGLSSNDDFYATHNDPVDRVNEVWRAIIQIRGGN